MQTRSHQALWNLGHVFYFFLLTLLFLKWAYFKRQSFIKQCLIIVLFSLIFGTLIEALQYGTARSASLLDIANDLLGGLLALTLSKKSPLFFKIFVITLSLLSLWPLSTALWDERMAYKQFPVLTDFSSALALNRWQVTANLKLVNKFDGITDAMKIDFKPSRYSKAQLVYFEQDWSQYQWINLELYNANKETLALTLKIFDAAHKPNFTFSDRLNLKIHLKQGWNHIRYPLKDLKHVPKKRLMDLKQIQGLSLFSSNLTRTREIYLKSIYLSP